LPPRYSPKTHRSPPSMSVAFAHFQPPGGGTARRSAVAHTAGVITFDTVHAPSLEQSPRCLPMATAQLIEAACRARDGDSHGARAHVTRAMELLDGHPGPRIAKPAGGQNSARRFCGVAVAAPHSACGCKYRLQDRHQRACGVTRYQRRSLLSRVQVHLRYVCSHLDQTAAHRVRSRTHAHDACFPQRDCLELWYERSVAFQPLVPAHRRRGTLFLATDTIWRH